MSLHISKRTAEQLAVFFEFQPREPDICDMENVQHGKIIDEICEYAEKYEIKVSAFTQYYWMSCRLQNVEMTDSLNLTAGDASGVYEKIGPRATC